MLSVNRGHYALTRRDFTRAIPSANLAGGITFQWRQIQTEACVYQRDSPPSLSYSQHSRRLSARSYTPVLMLWMMGLPESWPGSEICVSPKLTVSRVSPDKRKCLAEGLGCKHRCRVACCFSASEGGRRRQEAYWRNWYTTAACMGLRTSAKYPGQLRTLLVLMHIFNIFISPSLWKAPVLREAWITIKFCSLWYHTAIQYNTIHH